MIVKELSKKEEEKFSEIIKESSKEVEDALNNKINLFN